ncbi:hypothetical protein [Catenulispora subtropica]|uniref:DUF3618 domain-containing protein n=1 Tax=Catenulispora subtropica TaxID=450798 RepID=A0ABN2T8Z2_9ACTN
MNHSINEGVQAVRHTGQRVLDRVEAAAGEVAQEAREMGGRLTHHDAKAGKSRHKTGRIAGAAASAVAFIVALVVRRRHKHES